MNRKMNKIFSAITILALVLMALPMQSAEAAPSFFANPTSTVFINEIHYDNTGTDAGEAIEIAGPAGTDLTGWSIVLYNGSGGAVYDTDALSGTIPNQQGGYGTVVLTYPVNGIQNGSPDGIALMNGTTVVQFLSYEGTFTAVGGPANGVASTDIGVSETGSEPLGQSLQLAGTGDTYGDFTWAGVATNTFGSPNTGQMFDSVSVNLSINDVSANEGNSGTTSFDFTVSLSPPAGAGGVTFDIATADNTATVADNDYAANSLTGYTIPEGSSSYTFSVLVNGDATEEPDETFFVNITNVVGANVTDGQGQGTIVNDDTNFCALAYTPVYQIQGSGSAAAITGNVTTQGVVVGDFEGTASASGFYIQDLTGDSDATTSDGIFVFTGSSNLVSAGDVVRVTGFARERFNQTTLNGSDSNTSAVPAGNIIQCGTGSVTATDVTMPFADLTYPERFEGMLVRLPQALVISEYFNYDRFGEIVLALPLDGETRAFTPTSIVEPGEPAQDRALANSLRRITLDDANSAQNPATLRHPNGAPFSLANRFRGGDKVQNTVGVLGFDFSLYRIFPTGPAEYTAVNPRPAAPEPVGGSLRVAAMNTLNFFLTLDTTTSDTGPGPCGGNQNLDCRGADSNQPLEFTRQRDKLLAALDGLDADIIGLNELENTPNVDPLGDPTNGIVAGLNALQGPGTYNYINTGVIGTDAIRVGLIYRPGVVTPIGVFQILDSTDDPRFLDNRSRPALAQTFEVNATGARFTVVVNHLKSKGDSGLASTTSTPPGICVDADPNNDTLDCDQGDGQGYWNYTRAQAAQALVDWLASDPTESGDADFLIMGDLNSYAQEDPIDAIKAGSDDTAGTGDDYTNLIAQYQGTYAYSYVFDGQAGYLDHALANQSLAGQVTGAADWHINADEPDILDYDTSFKPAAQDALYEPNAYRSSDHDPVIVGLDLNAPPVATDDSASVAKNSSVAISALDNDFDVDGDTLTVVSYSQGAHGTVKYSAKNNNFRYTPARGFHGTDTFTYTISDGQGHTATATVTVTVQ